MLRGKALRDTFILRFLALERGIRGALPVALDVLAKVTWLRVAALVVNLFAIAYLLWTKRLFGFRGGHAAFEAERHNDSLLEVERAVSLEEPKTR